MRLEDKEELVSLLLEKKRREAGRKLESYTPYHYQAKFHNESKHSKQRLLMAANRIGKTFCGAAEMAYHLTGLYPDWWDGHRFTGPIRAWAGGTSNDKVKTIIQHELLGEPSNPDARGTGAIPRDCIHSTSRKAGIPDALSSVLVKHVSGELSRLGLLSYEAGKEAWMGESLDLIWLDEEPPQEVYTQALRGIVDRGGYIYMTFTPENGITEVVRQFTTDLKSGQSIQNATWDDAPHITGDVKEQILAALPEHERKMRSMGLPMLGSGLIYPIDLESVKVEPFEIPSHWPRIAAIDFGYEHPAAWVSAAWDRDNDIVYITDCAKMRKKTPDAQVQEIQSRGGGFTPTAWPQDGLTSEKGSGIMLKSLYQPLYLLPDPFKNPVDHSTGKANNSVEAGIMSILERMQRGSLKVFQHLEPLFEELRMYHRKDGKIVKKFDDAVDAMRYCIQSLPHSQCPNHSYKPYIPFEHEDYYANDAVGY